MKLFLKYLLLVYCFLPILSYAQANLVINPSFEDTTSCPNGYSQIYLSPPWISPTLGTPDYFNNCSALNCCSVPNNVGGTQNPRTGNAYAGFYAFEVYGTVNPREYIQSPITCNLIRGETYCVDFFVSLSDNISEYAVNNIGAYFSTLAVSDTNWNPLPYSPQIENVSSNPLTNTNGWSKISGQFIANGGEHFITIGNFNNNALSDTIFIQSLSSLKLSYYYIDDVSVIHLDAGAGNDTAICSGGSVLLGRPAKAWLTYSWQPASGLSNTTTAQPIANPTVTTTYYLTAGLAGGCSKQDTVTITVVNANAGADTNLCYGGGSAIGTASLSGINYTWQPTIGLSNAGIAQPIATPNATTTYIVTAAANGCTLKDSVNVTVLPSLAVNAGNDVTIILGTSTTLTGAAITGSTFTWLPSIYLSCDTCVSTIVAPLSTTTYILTANKNSCSSSDTVTVYVDTDCGELFVPNVFSPNGDGANDVLKILGNCITSIDLLIFDRWGETVFESTYINFGWDGTFKGQQLDEAVFVYCLTAIVNGVKVEKRGNVSIVR